MTQLPEGFLHVGDGRLSVSDELLKRLKTSQDIKDVYEIEESWIAKYVFLVLAYYHKDVHQYLRDLHRNLKTPYLLLNMEQGVHKGACMDLLLKCLQCNPDALITVKQILQHKYFSG